MSLIVNTMVRDLAILWQGQQTDADSRVPTAEELAATEEILRGHVRRSRAMVAPSGLLTRPSFTATAGRQIAIPELSVWANAHPTLTAVPAHALSLPALPAGTQNRYDYIYLLAFSVKVTASLDPSVALTFQWRNGAVLESVTKENTARLRDVYAFWVSPTPMSAAAIAAEVGSTLTVNKAGTLLGTGRIYPLDSVLLDGLTYTLQGELEAIDLLRVWRVQGVNQSGWWWGETVERALETEIHLQPTYQYVGSGWQDWISRTEESLYRLMRGESLQNSPRLNRGVFNLLNGQVGSNTQAPGIATTSRNGSTALANGQRITFTNRAFTQTTFALPVETTDDDGVAVATVNFAGNSPSGAKFAATGHQVIAASGENISAQGTFTGGDGTGALTWTANTAGTPAPGSTVYLVAHLSYPSGSGLPVCGETEAVYLNGVALLPANVRESDLAAYTAPSGGDTHIVIMNRANGSIRWIYKKFTVNSDSGGVLRMPDESRGLIAFLTGSDAPAGRQDKAVITGLANNGTYDVLCYHAPTAEEQWQFQILSPVYPGLKTADWLDGATITTAPIAFAHTLGGGTTFSTLRPRPDGNVADHVVAWRLPSNADGNAIADHTLDSAIALNGAPTYGNPPFQRLPAIAALDGVVGLRPGLELTATATVDAHPQGLGVELSVAGLPLGIHKPRLVGDGRYQLVVACGVEKGGEQRILVLTFNGGNPAQGNTLAAASTAPNLAGIDLFRYH